MIQATNLFIKAIKYYKEELEKLMEKSVFLENLINKKLEKKHEDIIINYFDY